jgi:hypothetical protein
MSYRSRRAVCMCAVWVATFVAPLSAWAAELFTASGEKVFVCPAPLTQKTNGDGSQQWYACSTSSGTMLEAVVLTIMKAQIDALQAQLAQQQAELAQQRRDNSLLSNTLDATVKELERVKKKLP